MELFLNLTFIVLAYILFAYIFYKSWFVFFNLHYNYTYKRTSIIKESKRFGILWPLILQLLAIILVIFIITYGR